MAYPPNQSGYPYPPNQMGQGNAGFGSCSQRGEVPGYPMYPQGRGDFPYSAASSVGFGTSAPSPSLPYSISPGGSCPYLPASNTSYPSNSNSSIPYSLPGVSSSPYPPTPGIGSSPYPPIPGVGSSQYPPTPGVGSSPYPPTPGVGSSPYPPTPGVGSSPYPPTPGEGSSPYPPTPGVGSSPYPPTPGVGSSPYPPTPGVGSSPYPPTPGVGSSPYPPTPGVGSSPYPPASGVDSSYLSQPGVGSDPYSSQRGGSPFSQTTYPTPGASLPQNAPYPPRNSSYPPVSNYPNTASVCSSPYQQNTNVHQNYTSTSSSSCSGNMWPYQERATIRPNMSFDPSNDASLLRKAMKGFGTDESTIIQILGRRTSHERQQIIPRYQQSFGKDLIKDLRGELSGDFLQVVDALMCPLPEFLAKELNRAIAGIGTNERTLIEILCTSDNNTLRGVKASYQHLFRKPLEADIKGDTSAYFGRLMVAMSAAFRDETGSNPSLAPGLAQSLYAAGVKKLGTDEAEFIRILSTYSYPLLRCVFEEYRKISGGKTFESAIKSELSGDLGNGMLAIYECINNRAAFYARHLYESMKGMGTRDTNLIRIVVWRSEIDMGNVKDEFKSKYGKRLEDAISSETSGDYKKILLALIQG